MSQGIEDAHQVAAFLHGMLDQFPDLWSPNEICALAQTYISTKLHAHEPTPLAPAYMEALNRIVAAHEESVAIEKAKA